MPAVEAPLPSAVSIWMSPCPMRRCQSWYHSRTLESTWLVACRSDHMMEEDVFGRVVLIRWSVDKVMTLICYFKRALNLQVGLQEVKRMRSIRAGDR